MEEGANRRALLLDAADDLVRRKRLDEAVDAYDHAARVASEQGDGATAFTAAYRAAAIAHQQGDHNAAMRRFHAIVVRWPDHEQARAAHRLAIHHAGELLRAAPDDTLLDQYVTMLREHVRAWPESDEADSLRLRLGRIESGRGRVVEAIEALATIRPEFDDYTAVLELLRRCHNRADPVRRRDVASPTLLGRLAAAFPDDAAIQESYADALAATGQPDQLRRALEQYRVLAERSPEASSRWFRAKYAIAALHLRLGNAEQSAKIVRLLKVLHPELGGPEMRGRFDRLLMKASGG